MKAIVTCEECEGTPQAITQTIEAPLKDLGSILSAFIVAWHATPPHCPHKMRLDFVETPPESSEVQVRCLKPDCGNAPRETRAIVPIELVGAVVIAHHTSHEAHPLEFSYKGTSWRSPQGEKP